jgi:hypothetical protein
VRTGKKAKLCLARETLVQLEREILANVGGGRDDNGGIRSCLSFCVTQCGFTIATRC